MQRQRSGNALEGLRPAKKQGTQPLAAKKTDPPQRPKLFGSGCCRVFSSLSGFNRIDEILADGSRAVTGVGSRRVGLGAAFGLRLRGWVVVFSVSGSMPLELQACVPCPLDGLFTKSVRYGWAAQRLR